MGAGLAIPVSVKVVESGNTRRGLSVNGRIGTLKQTPMMHCRAEILFFQDFRESWKPENRKSRRWIHAGALL